MNASRASSKKVELRQLQVVYDAGISYFKEASTYWHSRMLMYRVHACREECGQLRHTEAQLLYGSDSAAVGHQTSAIWAPDSMILQASAEPFIFISDGHLTPLEIFECVAFWKPVELREAGNVNVEAQLRSGPEALARTTQVWAI